MSKDKSESEESSKTVWFTKPIELRTPFSDALVPAAQLADFPPDALRSFLERAQNWCDEMRSLETDQDGIPAYRAQPVSTLGMILLSYLGTQPPDALQREIDRRLPTLGTEAMHDCDVFYFPTADHAEGYRVTIRMVRQLLAAFAPGPHEGMQ